MKRILETVQVKNEKTGAGSGRISKKVSLPILGGLAALIFMLLGGVYWQYAEERERQASSELTGAVKLYLYSTENYRETLSGIVELLSSDDRLLELLLEHDGNGLVSLYGESFRKMRQTSRLTYLLFADDAHRVITRIHQPDDKGDTIERASFDAAERDGGVVTTLDAGSDGRLSLRVVASVRSGGRHVGFIEAGIEMERVLAAAAKPEKVDIILALDKEHISRERIHFSRPGDGETVFWYDSGGKYYFYTTLAGQNAAFGGALRTMLDANGFSGDRHFNFSLGTNSYAVSSLPLADSVGNSLGAFFAVYNATALRNQYITAALIFLGCLLAVAAIVRHVLAGRLRVADADIADMESALVEGEHLFESIYAESDTAFIIRAADGGAVLKANAAALRIFSAAEAEGIDLSLLVPAFPGMGQTSLMTIHPKEKELFFETARFPIGSAESLECIAIRDVTDSVLLAQEDRAHIEFLQTVINQLPGWVCIKDSSLLLTQTNNVFDAVFSYNEYTPDTIRHSEWLDNGMDKLLDADRAALRSGKPVTLELPIPTGLGERIYSITKQRFTGRNGQIFILSSGNDITERAEMMNQLVVLNKKSEEVALLKTQFLARMSHELRTPMNAVLGMSHLALKMASDDRLRGWLNKIRESASALLQLISNILDFSQLEAGEVRLKHECFALEGILDAVEAQTRELAAPKPVTVVPDTTGASGQFLGDAERIRQVLQILCDNAVKFTEKGQVRLACSVSEDDDRYSVTFAVEDTGIGIPDEHLASLSESFHQVDGGMTRKYEGAGLGLALARHILALMNSQLEVQSALGQGSRFSFSLSLHRDSLDKECRSQDAAPLSEAPLRQTGEENPSPAQVLVVEDNEMNQEIILELLAQANVAAQAVNNGKEAVDIVKEQAFDLILMDLQMPVMGGVEAATLIRKFESGTDGMIPIIALTANAMESDKAECAAAGMNDFMSKPIDVEELHEKLRLWLNVTPARNSQTPNF